VSLWLVSCERKPEKVERRLQVTRVYSVPDPVDSTAIRIKQYLARQKDTSYIEYVFRAYDLVNIKTVDSTIEVNLRYADTNNFMKRNLYDGLRKAYFTCEMAIKVCAAQYFLKKANPHLSLVILDASRPQHIQKLMWDSLKMPPLTKFSYLSPPKETSLHNYGCAVDATIRDLRTGALLDMGTEYDVFEKLSQPVYEVHFLKTGELSREAFQNRRLLRMVMQRAKLNPINSEWWHFSSVTREEAMERFPLIK
jgi:D-alanyl-D-alanine dipeptidase